MQYLPIGICFSVGTFRGEEGVRRSPKGGGIYIWRWCEPILVVGLTY
ncbi:hypothetical protein HMPREF3185_01235, partial [Porphyromonas somerae]